MPQELACGELSYDFLTDRTAQLLHAQLTPLNDLYTKLGAIQAVTFAAVDSEGVDVYDVKVARGSVRVDVILTPDGRTVAAWGPG